MQAIQTKYFGPTNYRGARVKATCEAKTIILNWDHALNAEDNHLAAARALIAKLQWFHEHARGDRYGKWYIGGTADGYVVVCAVEHAEVKE